MAYTKQIVVNAPAEKVFEYLADLPRHSEWAAHRLKIEPVSDGPTAAGSRFKSTGHQFGLDSVDDVTVAEYLPPQRLALDVSSKDGRFRHTFALQPEGSGTRLTKSFDILQSNLVMKLTAPVIMLLAPKVLGDDLKRIKAKLE